MEENIGKFVYLGICGLPFVIGVGFIPIIRPLDKLLPGETTIKEEFGSFFHMLLGYLLIMIIYSPASFMLIFGYYTMNELQGPVIINVPLFFILMGYLYNYKRNLITLTDQRVVGMGNRCLAKIDDSKVVKGNRSSLDIPLDKVDSMIVELGFWSTITGTGNIMISTSAVNYTFKGFQMPEHFKNLVMEQVDRLRKEQAELQRQQELELAEKQRLQQDTLAEKQRLDAIELAKFQAEAIAEAMKKGNS